MKSVLKILYQYSKNKEIKELIFQAFNEDYSIRSDVARNENTTTSILEFLSNDKNANVRSWVAYNPRTPAYVLEKLSNDNFSLVRYYVALNLNTSIHILEKLISDRNNDISENALETIKKQRIKNP